MTTIWRFIARAFMAVLVRLMMPLRSPWSRYCRWRMKETERIPISFERMLTPQSLLDVFSAWQYRHDSMLDYVSHPEYTQYLIDDRGADDGDCDDHALYAMTVLKRMPNVKRALMLSVVYSGGGHATTVFQEKDGRWYWMDWRGLKQVQSPNLVPKMVAEKYASRKRKDPWVIYYVFEEDFGRAAAISPRKLRT